MRKREYRAGAAMRQGSQAAEEISRVPVEAKVLERVQDSRTIFTLRLQLTDPERRARYRFAPGQFNMVYLYGVGEIPISIVSDPGDETLLDHTVRAVGRVTRGLAKLKAGDSVGIRGPFGHGWPLEAALGRDVVLITGGLGCAPAVSVINYVVRRRSHYGRLTIMQGVKHADDLIWRSRYEQWARLPDTQVLLAADVAGKGWAWHVGRVTALFEQARIDPEKSAVMLCGPEIMMAVAIENLLQRGVAAEDIWLSMERNMQCSLGHCGHCQIGDKFVCKDGPVFRYHDIRHVFQIPGF